jgi:putative FmdB family regulatory protein
MPLDLPTGSLIALVNLRGVEMPIYEFRCRNCGTRLEALLRAGENAIACPSCGATTLDKQVSAPALVTTGRRREAAHTCCGRDERCGQPPCSDGGSCRRD